MEQLLLVVVEKKKKKFVWDECYILKPEQLTQFLDYIDENPDKVKPCDNPNCDGVHPIDLCNWYEQLEDSEKYEIIVFRTRDIYFDSIQN